MASAHNLTYEILYKNDSMSFPLVSATTVTLDANTNSKILINMTLMANASYTFRITNDHEEQTVLYIDSIVLMPDFKDNKLFKTGINSVKDEIKRCWDQSMNSRTMQISEDCRQIVFSTAVEIFDGAKGMVVFYC